MQQDLAHCLSGRVLEGRGVVVLDPHRLHALKPEGDSGLVRGTVQKHSLHDTHNSQQDNFIMISVGFRKARLGHAVHDSTGHHGIFQESFRRSCR